MFVLDSVRNFITNSSQSIVNFRTHFYRWSSHARVWGLIDYRQEDFDQLRSVNSIYQQCIVANQIVKKSKSLKSSKPSKKSKAIAEDDVLNNPLDIDWKKKMPKANEHEIFNCFILQQSEKRGQLRESFIDIFNFIKASVSQRLSEFAAKRYTYIDDAVILFCAEFSRWIDYASREEVSEALLNDINNRLNYLRRFEEEAVFGDEAKSDYSIYLLIFNIHILLSRLIKPEIEAELSQQSAREHFGRLTKSLESFLSSMSKGLFYVFTDAFEMPDIFSSRTHQLVSNAALDKALSTRLGDMFKRLTDHCEKSRCGSLDSLNQSSTSKALFNSAQGIPQEQEVFLLKGSDSLTTSSQNKKLLGVNKFMGQDLNVIRLLVHMMGLLADFSVLITGFKRAYDLAGNGGDILIYLALCQETQSILLCYSQYSNKLLHDLRDLLDYTESQFGELVKRQDMHPWRQTYVRATRYLDEAKKFLIECNECVSLITFSMQRVLSQNYVREVKDKIQDYRDTIVYLQGRIGRIDGPEEKNSKIEPNSHQTSMLTSDLYSSTDALIERQKQLQRSMHDMIQTNPKVDKKSLGL